MPNLVGLRDDSSPLSVKDQAKHDTLVAMQMEALGLRRREFLSTTDFKENKVSYVPTVQLESHRLVNKGAIGKGEKSKLEGWNNAWTHLEDDGTDVQNLQAVNEGLGQTHRARLMRDDSVRDYTGEENFRKGNRDTRGGHGDRGGRGGGRVGRLTDRGERGKAKGERRVTFQNETLIQPVTRVRVPKGSFSARPNVPRRQPIPILKTASAVKPAKGNMTIQNTPAASIRRPIRYEGMLAEPSAFMASFDIRKGPDEPGVKVAPPVANVSKDKASGHNIGSAFTTATSTSNERKSIAVTDTPSAKPTTAADTSDTSTVPVTSCLKANLMDLDIDQETTQPVLQFTASRVEEQSSHRVLEAPSSFDQQIEALEKSGLLSTVQLDTLRSIQAQVHARKDANTPVSEAPRPETYTRSELVSLRPKAAAPKVTTSIARRFAEQRDAFLIGEHVHQTRYHTAASLTEDFQKLTISDKIPVEATAASLPTLENPNEKPISAEKEKSKTNPFGPPPHKRKGPSLPAHLLAQSTTVDHGAAARAQYSGGSVILTSISNQQAPKDVNSTMRPTRRNMINQTGFIALAENRANSVAAGKKGEDPLLVARKRGL